MKLHQNNMIMPDVLIEELAIKFDSIEECIEFKNRLIAFIKHEKRDVRDKGLNPKLIFNITKTNEQ